MAGPWEQYAAPAAVEEAGPWAQYRPDQTQSGPSKAEDMLKSLGIGTAKGVLGLAGFIPDISEIGAIGLDKATTGIGNLVGQDWSRATRAPNARPLGEDPIGSAAMQRGIEGKTGEFYKPQTTAGEYSKTVGEFLPGAAIGPGGVLRRLLSQAVVPGVASEYAGQQTKGTAAEPYARVGAAVAGSILPGAAGRLLNPAQGVSAERRAAGDTLRAEGITPTAGQETGSNIVKALESPFGYNPEPQLEGLTAAAMRRTGGPGGRATTQNVDQMFTRIGQQFDGLAARNTMVADQQFTHDVMQPVQDYFGLVSAPNRAPAVTNFMDEISNALNRNSGSLPGDVYQSLRSRMERTARSAPPEVADTIRGMRNALDDGMERTLASTNSPDLGAWRDARREYRNALVVERAIGSGGENAGLGLITPGQLSTATRTTHGRRNYVRGEGDFADLAHAADALLRPLPNSGTPVRAAAAALPSAVGAGIGGLLGLPAGGVGAGIGGTLGAIAGPAVTNAAINNPLVQAFLSGRIPGQGLLAGPTSTVARDAFMQAILRSQGLAAPLQITVHPSRRE